MGSALVKKFTGKVPAGLETFFNDPPLVRDEKREDYELFFSAIVADVKPCGAMDWLLARDVADLSWEIKREKNHKGMVVKIAQSDLISKLLSPSKPSLLGLPHVIPGAPKTDKIARQWINDSEIQKKVGNQLAKKGYDASYILTAALNRAAPHIDAIDRRIGIYELRRNGAMKAIEQYCEASARRPAVIDGEFTEAAEQVDDVGS